MTRPLRRAALALALALAGPAAAQEADRLDGPDVRLADASAFDGDTHVIVVLRRLPEGAAIPTGEALAARHDSVLAAAVPLPAVDETCYILRVADGADAAAVSAAVASEGAVLAAYPVQEFALRQDAEPATASASDPTSAASGEPLRAAQDALDAMGVRALHAVTEGAGVRVALVDTGVALDHPDLAGREVSFHDFVRDGTPARERHGTAMAALIAADASNGVGMTGVAPAAELMALRGCWEDEAGAGRCNTFSLALALDRAATEGADVVNLSLGGPPDALLANLVAAAQDGGALVVAASRDGEPAGFPAGLPGVVAAADEARADAVRAPALEVLSAEPGGGYDFFSGDSVAAAHVTGIAALLRSAAPDASAADLRAALTQGGDAALDGCAALERLPGGGGCDRP